MCTVSGVVMGRRGGCGLKGVMSLPSLLSSPHREYLCFHGNRIIAPCICRTSLCLKPGMMSFGSNG